MDRDTYIFKRISEHYREIKDKYEVIGIFLQGSQNYGLDIYDEDYKSDIDTKAIILPTLKDIVSNATPISTTLVLDNNEHIDLKDIRIMFDTFKKQNINFIEILFTKFRIINPKYKDLWEQLIARREEIARLDYNKALNCQAGMSQQKLVALKHPYPTIIDKIKKYGYDPKQLHHIMRMNDFIKKYVMGEPYEKCLIPDNIDFLIRIKKGELDLSTAEMLAKVTNEETYRISKNYQLNEGINQSAVDLLEEIKYKAIERYLKNSLMPVEKQKKEKQYKNIFVTSDIHFSHEAILKFENRPFNNVEEMNEKIVENWNATVGENDLVYILGDISMGSIKETMALLKRLNGDKILVKGNHDEMVDNRKFDRTIFKEISNCIDITIYGQKFLMCHYPFASNDNHKIQLYGHIHTNNGLHVAHDLPENSFNVCMDANNLTPVNIKDILKFFRKEINNEKNHTV